MNDNELNNDKPGSAPETTEKPSPNFTLANAAWSSGNVTLDATQPILTFPPAGLKLIQESITATGDDSIKGDKAAAWVESTKEGIERLYPNEGLIGASARPNARWTNEVPSSVGPLRPSIPRFKTDTDTVVTGQRLRMLARQKARLGTHVSIPLWHSGFWIAIHTPNESDILRLQMQMSMEKSTIGRKTYGQVFSTEMVYIKNLLVDFVLEHLFETTVAYKDVSELKGLIQQQDLCILEWALVSARSPNGVQYRRPCIADPKTCMHVIEEKLNPNLLLHVDISELTEYQIAHMTNRKKGSVDPTSLVKYRDEFMIGRTKRFPLIEDISIDLRMSNLQSYLDSGMRWVTDIETTYAQALTLDTVQRDGYLNSQGNASIMRRYSHLVERIIVGNNESESREDIEDILHDLSEQDEARTNFEKAVTEFLDSSVIAMVALPPHECPSCKRPQNHSAPTFGGEQLVPIDCANTFFSLVVHQVEQILNR
jgi:hypothetical protein